MVTVARNLTSRVLSATVLMIICHGIISPAFALKLSVSLKSCLQQTLPVKRIRLDGAVETKEGALYLPLLPRLSQIIGNNQSKIKEDKVSLQTSFPSQLTPDLLIFNNGWCYVRVLPSHKDQTVLALDKLPKELQKTLLSTKFPSDLIVPEHFVLPASLRTIGSSIAVTIKGPTADAVKQPGNQGTATKSNTVSTLRQVNNTKVQGNDSSNLTQSSQVNRQNSGQNNTIDTTTDSAAANKADQEINRKGCILVTSPPTGKISLISFPDLTKIMEFPTEGTPSGITFAAGMVYIADQSKCRILKLDPYRKLFLGQIDLPKHSTPKDVVALPSGKLLYVSESLFNDIAVIEADIDRLLLRTKVVDCPGRMAIAPNGNLLLVLNVSEGRVSLLSTQTQQFLGSIKVGSLPSGIAFSADSRTAYISNRVSNTVSVLDLVHHIVISNIKTGNAPTGLTIDSDKGRLYVANARDNSISIFNLKGNIKIQEIKLPLDLDFPGSLTFLPDKKHILVSSESTDAVGLLDTSVGSFDKIASVGHNTDQCLWIPAKE